MRISDWSSDVCSSDLDLRPPGDIGEVLLDAAPVLAQLQDAAEIFVGHIDGGVDPRLLDAVYMDRVGHVGRIVKLLQRPVVHEDVVDHRSEEHTSELQSLMRISYAVFCLKKTTNNKHTPTQHNQIP